MNLHHLLILIQRHAKKILLITALTTLASFLFGQWFLKNPYETTIFVSIGVEEQEGKSVYENVQAADQFTETVQGWFKNPSFLERIRENNGNIDLNVHKQEKQNLVISSSVANTKSAVDITIDIEQELKKEIQSYNQTTNSHFELALFSSDTKAKTNYLPLFILLGVIMGFFLAIGLSYLYEYLFGFASYPEKIETVAEKNAIDQLNSFKTKKLSFLGAYLQKSPAKNMMLAGINVSTHQLVKSLQQKLPQRVLKAIRLPEEANELTEAHQQHVIVVCQLGKTNLSDLAKLKMLLPSNFDLLIVQT